MFLIINNNKFNNKVIRLRKRGAKNIPIFDIVVMSKKQRRQGFFFDKLGYISIANKDHVFYLDSYKLAY